MPLATTLGEASDGVGGGIDAAAAPAGPRGTRLQQQLGSTPSRRLLIRAVHDVDTAVAGS